MCTGECILESGGGQGAGWGLDGAIAYREREREREREGDGVEGNRIYGKTIYVKY